jgi:threonine aldolase
MVVVDLRSDTVTKPTPAMRIAMAEAVVGDDVYKEDPTVNELERRCAELFGMEATLFVPTGTMGNLIAIMTHCDTRGSEMIVGSNHHIQRYEQGGYAQFAGVACSLIKPEGDGTMKLEHIQQAIRTDLDDFHQTRTRLLCLENTHLHSGGRCLPLDYLKNIRDLTNNYNIKVHMDGARLMNACVGLNTSPKEILKYVDSVSMCFSKGLGCPVGAILGGKSDFIKQALRMRKALGGGMRQAGILAAAALHVLDSPYEDMLRRDHCNAKKLAQGIADTKSQYFILNPDDVQTNIIFINTGSMAAQKIVDLLSQDDKSGLSILATAFGEKTIRLVTHRDLTDGDIDTMIEKFGYVMEKLHVIQFGA